MTTKRGSYKDRQRSTWMATFWDMAKIRLSKLGGPTKVKTRNGRTYIIDPVTGQWWRPEKWAARPRR